VSWDRPTWYEIWVDHHPRLNTTSRSIVNKYRGGKGEKNRGERSEKNLKPLTYNHSKPYRAIYGDGLPFA